MNPLRGWFNLVDLWGPPSSKRAKQISAQLVGGPEDGKTVPWKSVPAVQVPGMIQPYYDPGATGKESVATYTPILYIARIWRMNLMAEPVVVYVHSEMDLV